MTRMTWNTLPHGGWKSELVHTHEAAGLAADLTAHGATVTLTVVTP